jgi:hypothetical protein
MSTYKTTSGDYIITCDDGNGTLTINADLDVVGNVTYIETANLLVDDPFITVAANNAGSIPSATYQQQGLVAQTSASTFAGLRFNNVTLAWEISPNVNSVGAPITAYQAIGTGGAITPGGPDTAIQFNQSGGFAGNANLQYDYANSRLTLNGAQYIGYQSTPPAVANTVAISSNVRGSGGTGLFFTSTGGTDELVSKSAAIVFSIIF